jgi:tetratricopeptide (TPR) repeat protein
LQHLQRYTAAAEVLSSIKLRSATQKEATQIQMEMAAALSGEGKYEEALTVLDRAEANGADPVILAATRGLVFGEAHRGREAITNLLHAIDLDEHFAAAWFNLGCLEARQGAYEAAGECIHRAWREGLRDEEDLTRTPELRPLIDRHLLDDLLVKGNESPSCPL